jgi:hypothetical protein
MGGDYFGENLYQTFIKPLSNSLKYRLFGIHISIEISILLEDLGVA